MEKQFVDPQQAGSGDASVPSGGLGAAPPEKDKGVSPEKERKGVRTREEGEKGKRVRFDVGEAKRRDVTSRRIGGYR